MNFRCCIDCGKRYPACQDFCQDYRKDKAERAGRNERIRKAKSIERENKNYIREHYAKGKR